MDREIHCLLRRIRRRRVPWQQALVEQRAGPCPAAVISFNQTNMIEPRATLQWRHGHSLLLLVRNPNPSIHQRDSRSIYILRLTAVVPGWMRCEWQKKEVANMPRCCFGQPAKCKFERGQRKRHPDLVTVGFWLPGWLELCPPLQSVFPGRNQAAAGATSCLCRARTSAAAAPTFPPRYS